MASIAVFRTRLQPFGRDCSHSAACTEGYAIIHCEQQSWPTSNRSLRNAVRLEFGMAQTSEIRPPLRKSRRFFRMSNSNSPPRFNPTHSSAEL